MPSYGLGGGSVSALTSRFGSTLNSSSALSSSLSNDTSGAGASSTFRPSGTSGYIRSTRDTTYSKGSTTGLLDETSTNSSTAGTTATKRLSGTSLGGSATTPSSTPVMNGTVSEGNSPSQNTSSGVGSSSNSTSSSSNATGISAGGTTGLSSYKPYTPRSLLSSDIKPITTPTTPSSSLRTTARYGLKSGSSHAHYSASLPTASTLKAAAILTEEAKKQSSKTQYQKEKEDKHHLLEEVTSWLSRGTCTILDASLDLDDNKEDDEEDSVGAMKANEISNDDEPGFVPRTYNPRYEGVLKHKAVQTEEEPKSKYAGLTAIPRPPLTMNFYSPFTAVMNRFNAEKTAKAAANSSGESNNVSNGGMINSRRGSLKKINVSPSSSTTSPPSEATSGNNVTTTTKETKAGTSSSGNNKSINNATTTITSNSNISTDHLSRSSLPSRQTSPASRRNSITNKSRTTDGEDVVTSKNSGTSNNGPTNSAQATVTATSPPTKKLTTKTSSSPAAGATSSSTTTLNAGGLVVNLANKEFIRKSMLNVGETMTKEHHQDEQKEYGRKQEAVDLSSCSGASKVTTMQQKSSVVGTNNTNDDNNNEQSSSTGNNPRSSPLSTGLKRDSTRRPPTDPNKSNSVGNQQLNNRSIRSMSSQYNLNNNSSSANSSRASSPSPAANATTTGNCNSSPSAGGLTRIKSTKNVNPLRKLSLENANNASDSDSSVTSASVANNARSITGPASLAKLKKKLATSNSSDNSMATEPNVIHSAIPEKKGLQLRRGSGTGGGSGGGTTCSSSASSRSASVERVNSNNANGPLVTTTNPSLHPSNLRKSLSKTDSRSNLKSSQTSSSSDSEKKKKKGPVTIQATPETNNVDTGASSNCIDPVDSYHNNSNNDQQAGDGDDAPKQTPFFLRMMSDSPWVRKCQSGDIPWWMASTPDVPAALGRNSSRSVIKVPTTKDIKEELANTNTCFLLPPKPDNGVEDSSSSELSDIECDDDPAESKFVRPLGERTSPDGREIPSITLPDDATLENDEKGQSKVDKQQLFIGTLRNIDDILGFLPANLLAPSPSPAPTTPTPTPAATTTALQEAMDELVEAQRKLSLVGGNDLDLSESDSSSSSDFSDDEEDPLKPVGVTNPQGDDVDHESESESSDEDDRSTGTSSSFEEVDPVSLSGPVSLR